MLIGGLLTSGLGIVFFVACLALSFLIIAIAIRALHIFLLSVISIVLLIYISPITIAASLFERTKGIFQGWLKQLLGFTLQPVILFAYLAVMITIFDYVAIGPDVRFEGDGKKQVKRMICSGKAADTSLYCIFRAPNIKTNHALEVIGIGIPFLVSMNATKVNTIIKGVFLMFIFYEFMEKISYFASKLVGGKELKGSAPNIAGALKKVAGAAYGVQKRFTGMVAKHGVSAARGGINAAKSVGRSATDNGKAIAKTKDSSFSNATGGAGSSVATGGSTPAAATSSPASSSATGSTPPTS